MKANYVGWVLVAFSVVLLAMLGLIKANLDSQSAALCEFYHEKNLDMQQCPAHKSNTSWLVTLSFGIALLILGSGIYMLFLRDEAEVSVKKEPDFDVGSLDNEEKAVYESLKSNSGMMYQSDLVKATGNSKVKTTRILDRMESKGIVERKRRGMTNIVVIR